ncbi:phage regulatory CII family protein (plasmid) [Azospirillum sp. HJ39]|uniref:phage regulatory CII family protein n=1 Tax=Azospirillum sp. HJ39 TaxID=3159496 RepID=UPI0035583D68
MTLQRTPGSIEHALLQVVNELSPQEIETATGLKIGTFRRISNPLNGTALDLDDAAALDAALIRKGRPPRFQPLFQEIIASVVAQLGGAEAPVTDFGRSLRQLNIESGRLAKEIDDALADDHVDQAERRRIAAAANDVMEHARVIRDAAEPPHIGVVSIRTQAATA